MDSRGENRGSEDGQRRRGPEEVTLSPFQHPLRRRVRARWGDTLEEWLPFTLGYLFKKGTFLSRLYVKYVEETGTISYLPETVGLVTGWTFT